MFSLSSTRSFFSRLVTVLVVLPFLVAPQALAAQTLGGLSFDGIDDYAVLAPELATDLSNRDRLTLEIRLTFGELQSSKTIFSFSDRNNIFESHVIELQTINLLGLNFFVANVSDGWDNYRIALATPIRLDQEYLVTLVFDGKQRNAEDRTKLYIDGVQQALTGGLFSPRKTPSNGAGVPIYLARQDNNFANLKISEVRVWKTARNAQQVAANASGKVTNPRNGQMVSYYNFDTEIVPDALSGTPTLADQTGTSKSAYLFNMELGNSSARLSLPVELISFGATAPASYNLLNWTVASEREFGYYGVERSLNGSNDWEEIERVYPAGDAEGAEKQYFTTDATPPAAVYYRLRMVDLDGTFEYSDVVLQEREVAGVAALSVYPNPTTGPVTIELGGDEAVSLALTDMSGRRVWQQELSAGSAGRATLDTGVTPGVYLLTARSGSSTWNQRLVVR